MRSWLSFAVALFCVVAVTCSSLEKLRQKRQSEPVVIVDAGTSDKERPFFNPFFYENPADSKPTMTRIGFGDWGFGSDFTTRLNGMLSALQNQFDSLWRRFYDRVDGVRLPFYDTKGAFPPTYRNTTSTQKVVNGSVITVNETIDKQSNNDSVSFFHVKLIHVRPENPLPNLPPTEEEAEPESNASVAPESPIVEPEVKPSEREPFKPDHTSERTNDIEDNMP